MLIILLH